MPTSKVTFHNPDGQQLAGLLDIPAAGPRAFALFAHCFTCSKHLKSATNIVRSLNAARIAVLRFDFTGLGESAGDFVDTTFSTNIGDLVSAANFLTAEHMAPELLIGHSLGGAAMLAAAEQIPTAKALATIGAPSDPAHVKHLFQSDTAEIATKGQITVSLGGRPFTISQQFVDDLSTHSLLQQVAALRKPLLIMHAPLDDVVTIDNASELFLAASHPKSFFSLDKADHLLTNDAAASNAGDVLAAWASAYVAESQPASGGHGETLATTVAGGLRTELLVAGHAMTADEPVALGGTDDGPTPYDFLAASLAACTTITLTMYAQRKGLDLQAVSARVKHDKIHARDCEDCTSASGKVDTFSRELSFTGELSSAAVDRLLEIADMCPVHRTLHGEVVVRTTLAD
jgi:putative redox protein